MNAIMSISKGDLKSLGDIAIGVTIRGEIVELDIDKHIMVLSRKNILPPKDEVRVKKSTKAPKTKTSSVNETVTVNTDNVIGH